MVEKSSSMCSRRRLAIRKFHRRMRRKLRTDESMKEFRSWIRRFLNSDWDVYNLPYELNSIAYDCHFESIYRRAFYLLIRKEITLKEYGRVISLIEGIDLIRNGIDRDLLYMVQSSNSINPYTLNRMFEEYLYKQRSPSELIKYN